MKAIIGRKIGMSQMFSSEGNQVGVTLLSCLPNNVTLVRATERDGYAAVQLALPDKKVENTEKKHKEDETEKLSFAAKREFELEYDENNKIFDVTQFDVGDTIEVAGISKGKGYQGVVKRHGFKGGPASHGHRHVLRSAGSIGSRFPQHVLKGKKMAGRMGGDKITVKNLKIMWIDKDNHIIAVSGAVPGPKGSIVTVVSVAVEAKDI